MPPPSTFAAFSERVSLIIPLLFSSPAFSFRFFSTEEQKNIFFTLAVGLWLLAVSRLEDGELNSRGFSNPWTTSRFYN